MWNWILKLLQGLLEFLKKKPIPEPVPEPKLDVSLTIQVEQG